VAIQNKRKRKNQMASWALSFSGTKASVLSQLNAAVVTQATGFDPGNPLNYAETTLGSHFAAAITAAKNALASLVGSAPNAKIVIQGYRDTGTTPRPGSGSSRIQILATEIW
jgi:hypothetical protein